MSIINSVLFLFGLYRIKSTIGSPKLENGGIKPNNADNVDAIFV